MVQEQQTGMSKESAKPGHDGRSTLDTWVRYRISKQNGMKHNYSMSTYLTDQKPKWTEVSRWSKSNKPECLRNQQSQGMHRYLLRRITRQTRAQHGQLTLQQSTLLPRGPFFMFTGRFTGKPSI
ncbi:unnamed protein product [Caenorhabditis nigoni]